MKNNSTAKGFWGRISLFLISTVNVLVAFACAKLGTDLMAFEWDRNLTVLATVGTTSIIVVLFVLMLVFLAIAVWFMWLAEDSGLVKAIDKTITE